MDWNNSNTLKELTICPNCNKELDTNQLIITKSGRKSIDCVCGCRICENTKRMWFCIPQETKSNNDTKMKGYYEQHSN